MPVARLLDYQPSAALVDRWDKEHFGYSDGISGTFFRDCGEDPRLVIGGGKPTGKDPRTIEGWEPLEPGEFILGHADEVRRLPGGPGPAAVLAKRHVSGLPQAASERRVVQLVSGAGRRAFPGGKEALAAKFAGRWRNGAPLTRFPTEAEADQFVNEVAALQARVRGQDGDARGTQARLDELKLQFVGLRLRRRPRRREVPVRLAHAPHESAQRARVWPEGRIRPAGVRHARRRSRTGAGFSGAAFHTALVEERRPTTAITASS